MSSDTLRAAALAGLLLAACAAQGPRQQGAQDLALAPLDVLADTTGGVGLIGGALVGTLGDVVALADRNPVTRGLASDGVQVVGWSVSWVGTRSLELLRREDIERWPEPLVAYRGTATFTGRLDTALSGLGAFNLAVRDLVLAPSAALLRISGAVETADALDTSRREAALHFLGPTRSGD